MRFVIGSQDYGDQSCGVRALNRLCHWLNTFGHETYLGGTVRYQRPLKLHPEWDVKAWNGVMTDDTIAIYPDAYNGNPYGARRVVRWCLYHPGQRGGAATFGPHDRIYYYADMFKESTLAAARGAQAKRLYISVFEPHILFPDSKLKLYDAFWVGRGLPPTMAGFDGQNMYEFMHPFATRMAFANALRRARNFYSFDPCSAMVPEAMLCGANVFQVDNGVARKIDFKDPEMLGANNLHAFNAPVDVHPFLDDMEAWA